MRFSDFDTKLKSIRSTFASAIGAKLVGYETAELLLTDGTWSPWPDLPIRLRFADGQLISVSWSKFDDLWLANDESVPFSIEEDSVRWIEKGIDRINVCLGSAIRSVWLGQGAMTWGGVEAEIWTRLALEFDIGWLEIFDALDENGYAFHAKRPMGQFHPGVVASG